MGSKKKAKPKKKMTVKQAHKTGKWVDRSYSKDKQLGKKVK